MRGRLQQLLDLLQEMRGFEYYVVSKKFQWLLSENHHDTLTAVGQLMVEKLECLRTRLIELSNIISETGI